KGRSWIGLERFAVGFLGGFAQGYTARIGVLDDDASARVKAAYTFPGGIGVSNIVVGQFLALQLLVATQQTFTNGAVCVESRALVRVLAIAQSLLLFELNGQHIGPGVHFGGAVLGRLGLSQAAQVSRDGTVVSGGVGVDLGSQFQTQAVRRVTSRAVHISQHAFVIDGVNDDTGAAFRRAVVFGSSAQHGGATNINVLYRIGKGATRLGNGFTERVKVDDQQIDTVNAVLFHSLQVFGAVATGQQATVNFWMQCFDTAIQNFWRTGVLGHFGNSQAGQGQQLGRAASG